MRFVVDECAGPAVSGALRKTGHDVLCVNEECPGATDLAIIRRAFEESRVLITLDKDFGELVWRSGLPHCGVILLRLQDQTRAKRVTVVTDFVQAYGPSIENAFCVVTEDVAKFRR